MKESYYVYVLMDKMNNKPMLVSDNYFLISDYKDLNNLTNNMGFGIDSYDYANLDYDVKTWVDNIKRLQ